MTLRRSRRFAVIVFAALSVLLLPAVSQSETVRMKATDSRRWNPDFKHIEPGSKIVWRNPTSLTHTVTAYGGRWTKDTRLTPGTGTSKIFKRQGVYKFRCKKHSTVSDGNCNGMCGVVHVEKY
ncbi:MAG: hypothetical protein H0U53_03195 [Actinobacteria bacterium]|nr:hypothetical protein [Actinomycetota bacterium]